MTMKNTGTHGRPEMRSAPGGRQRGWREPAIVLLGAVALTAVMTYPLAFHLDSIGRTDNFDGQFSIWNVAWVARTLVVDPIHVFDANIFYPRRWTLAYSEANLGAGALAIPAYWATRNPYVATNFVTLLSFVLSGLGTYYLVRYLSQDRRAAAISAICFAYCPYVFARFSHIQLLMTAGLPFSMLAFHRLVDRPAAGRAVVLGLVMAAQAISCGYYGVFAMLMIGFSVIVVATTRRLWTDVRYWSAIATAGFVAVAVVLPLFVPYIILQRTTGFARSLEEGRAFAADWRAYLASSAYSHAWMLNLLGHWKDVAFPGFLATALGVTGAIHAWSDRGRSREIALLYGGFAVLSCWASFGPGGGLYTALYHVVPGFTLLRAASRFSIVVVFALSVLAGIAVADILRREIRPALMSVALGVVALGDLAVPMPFRPVPPVDAVYRFLATLPRGPVLEMPVYSQHFAFIRSSYMLASTFHWMPLVDAYSDYIPQDFNNNLEILGDFPNREAFALLEPSRVRYAVFHVDKYQLEATARLRRQLDAYAPYLRRKYADEHAWLYEIVGFPLRGGLPDRCNMADVSQLTAATQSRVAAESRTPRGDLP
jgi:hypothetical protein